MQAMFPLFHRACLARLLTLASALILCSCASLSAPPQNPITSSPPATAAAAPAASPALFHEFPDIPVPAELTPLHDDSYIYREEDVRAGVLILRGRVDVGSLIRFFQVGLPRQGWVPKGGMRYRRSVLLFEKPDKSCVIDIYEKLFYTYAEIYVVPAAGNVNGQG